MLCSSPKVGIAPPSQEREGIPSTNDGRDVKDPGFPEEGTTTGGGTGGRLFGEEESNVPPSSSFSSDPEGAKIEEIGVRMVRIDDTFSDRVLRSLLGRRGFLPSLPAAASAIAAASPSDSVAS